MRDFLNITGALADRNRLRLLLALEQGELCVCEMTEFLGLAISTVSKHLSILYKAGLVDMRKEGRWMYYSLPQHPLPAAREALAWVRHSLGDTPETQADAARLKKVLAMDPVKLCKRICKN
jgi:DNA-binding transcriptional ArsR family regulator